jgi:hypothetical protein
VAGFCCDTPWEVRDLKVRSVQDSACLHTSGPVGPNRDRRPGHSPDRTLRGTDRPHHPRPRTGPPRAGRPADGRHPGPVRHLRRHREALRPVRVRRVRLRPEPFPLVLGVQAAAHPHLRRHRDQVQPGQPGTGGRAGPGPPDPSNATAAACPPACGPGSSSGSSHSTPASGTIGSPAPRSSAPSSPTTTRNLPTFPDQRSSSQRT